jgi:hypothetical protein
LIWLNVDVKKEHDLPFMAKIAQLDILGNILFLGSIICLLLALQWGGVTYPWGNVRIVSLFFLFAIFLTAFVGVQIFKGDNATGNTPFEKLIFAR